MVKKLIFTNDLKYLKKFFAGVELTIINILQIKYDDASPEIIDYFENKGIKMNFIQGREFIESYEKLYSEYMAQLNIDNNDILWWALNLSNKNPLTTALCDRIYYAILINLLIKQFDSEYFLVIDDDKELYNQIKINQKNNNKLDIICAVKRLYIKKKIKNICPVSIIYIFLKTLICKIMLLICVDNVIKKRKTAEYLIIVMSLLYNPSFKNNKYQDVYFGSFVDFLKEKKKYFVNFMEVCASYRVMLKKSRLYGRGYNIFPKEYFVSFKSVLIVMLMALLRFFSPIRLKGYPKVYNIDVSWLINRFIRYEYISTSFFSNLLMYYSVADLCRRYGVGKFYYPFENRSFEKMIILALRKFSPQTKIIGYQHASISLRHTNFLLGKDEYKITPLPDVILTMGEITREIMRDIGKFPENLLRAGCALRQKPYQGQLKKKRIISNILVALATNIEEYVKVLHFLNAAFEENNSYHIWIRPHPVFSLEEAIKITGQPRFRFHKADKETLEECYDWSDVVLYVHSTLSIEAIMRGIPVININIGEPLNPDPLFNFADFKWRVDAPQELIPTVEKINLIDGAEFKLRQEKAKAYAQRYIIKVDDSKLENFLNVR